MGYQIPVVRTIEEIRHANLLSVISRFHTVQAFANAIGRSHSQVSQLKNRNPNSGTGKPRNVDSKIARLIEDKLKLDPGWMDNDHDLVAWPFPLVDRARLERLSDADRIHVQKGLISLLAQYEDTPYAPEPLGGSTAVVTGDGGHQLGTLHEPIRKPYRAASR